MHDNNLAHRINLIFTSLKSKEIIDFLNQWNIDKLKLLTLVIESKIGYDRLIADSECRKFINDIEEQSVYNTSEYSELIMFISTMGDANHKYSNGATVLNKFQVFHKMLFKTGTLVLKLLNDKHSTVMHEVKNESIVNPLFNRHQQVNHKAEDVPKHSHDAKIFSITPSKPVDITPVEPVNPAPAPELNKGEMTLSNFLKSLATG